jgi:hypothetical protein
MLWLLPGVGHVAAFREEPIKYVSMMDSFIHAAESKAPDKP